MTIRLFVLLQEGDRLWFGEVMTLQVTGVKTQLLPIRFQIQLRINNGW